MDFRAWLIAQGKKIFYDALSDPEILVDFVQVKHDDIFGAWGDAQLELMNYVTNGASEVVMERA
jgi:hypothetical protein